jgi:hypothetical protein
MNVSMILVLTSAIVFILSCKTKNSSVRDSENPPATPLESGESDDGSVTFQIGSETAMDLKNGIEQFLTSAGMTEASAGAGDSITVIMELNRASLLMRTVATALFSGVDTTTAGASQNQPQFSGDSRDTNVTPQRTFPNEARICVIAERMGIEELYGAIANPPTAPTFDVSRSGLNFCPPRQYALIVKKETAEELFGQLGEQLLREEGAE